MGERHLISQLKNGMTVDQVFLLRDKDLRTTRSGDLYISCTLADKSGTVPARMWQATETIFKSLTANGFIQIKGRVEDYKGNLQIIIDACRPWSADKVDLAEFMPVTELDVEQMWAEALEILRDIKDPPLRLLIKKFLEDRELVAAIKKSPAAMQMHHPFIGGLLEHTLNILRGAKALLPLYPKLNADLVLAGAFLHDVGKTAELTAGTSITYTDRGHLIGHITMTVIWIHEKAVAVAEETSEPIPPKTLNLLEHIILSHHGALEFGSPKLPMIPEAFFIHYLDNLDAKVWMTTHAAESDPDSDSSFTPYMRQLETRIYKHSGELQ